MNVITHIEDPQSLHERCPTCNEVICEVGAGVLQECPNGCTRRLIGEDLMLPEYYNVPYGRRFGRHLRRR
jgi:hypothetical protein